VFRNLDQQQRKEKFNVTVTCAFSVLQAASTRVWRPPWRPNCCGRRARPTTCRRLPLACRTARTSRPPGRHVTRCPLVNMAS